MMLSIRATNATRWAPELCIATNRQSIGRQIETLRTRVKDTRDTAYSLLAALHEREKRVGELPLPPN